MLGIDWRVAETDIDHAFVGVTSSFPIAVHARHPRLLQRAPWAAREVALVLVGTVQLNPRLRVRIDQVCIPQVVSHEACCSFCFSSTSELMTFHSN